MSPFPRPVDHAERRLVDAYLVDELDERGAMALAAHVRDCVSCTAELGTITRLMELLRTLPQPAPSPDLDARIIDAAISDRRIRRESNALGGFFRHVLRGAMRTTGTLVATIIAISLVGAAFVFAASSFILPFPPSTPDTSRATLPPVATPTLAPTEPTRSAAPTGQPTRTPAATAPVVVSPTETPRLVVTPPPTVAPTPAIIEAPTSSPEPTTTPDATPSPEPIASVTPEPSVSVEPSVTPEPTVAPTAEPTATPRPEPSDTPSPSPSATASPSPTPSVEPTDSPTPSPDPSATPKPRRTPPASVAPSESPGGSTLPDPFGSESPSP